MIFLALFVILIAFGNSFWGDLLMVDRFVVPVMIEYEDSGEFTKKKRLIAAIKKTILINLIVSILGVIALAYLLYTDEIQLSMTYQFIISLVNA